MDEITHISVGPRDAADPGAPAQAVYVAAPAPDVLDAEPFASGRHRLERLPGDCAGQRPATLWSWSEGDG